MYKLGLLIMGMATALSAIAQSTIPELTPAKRTQIVQEGQDFVNQWQKTNGAAITQAINGEKPTIGMTPEVNKASEEGVNFAKGMSKQPQPTQNYK